MSDCQSFNNISRDILLLIFNLFKSKQLLYVSLVSKYWRKLIFESNCWNNCTLNFNRMKHRDLALKFLESKKVIEKTSRLLLHETKVLPFLPQKLKFLQLVSAIRPSIKGRVIFTEEIKFVDAISKKTLLNLFKTFPIVKKGSFYYMTQGDKYRRFFFDLNNSKDFGLFSRPSQKIKTPIGNAIVVGISEGELWIHIDNYRGASFYSNASNYQELISEGFQILDQ